MKEFPELIAKRGGAYTKREIQIYNILKRSHPKPVTRQEISDIIYGRTRRGNRAISVLISLLRSSIRAKGLEITHHREQMCCPKCGHEEKGGYHLQWNQNAGN